MFSRLIITILLSLLFSFSIFANKGWKEISSAELAMKAPKVETSADAEAIFWETRINHKSTGEIETSYYIRLKIFTERGATKFNKLEFSLKNQVEDISARVINPNGQITEINEGEFLIKEIAKNKNVSLRAKAAPIPNIQIGSILEYKFRETTYNPNSFFIGTLRITFFPSNENKQTLNLQQEIPIQNETFFIKLNGSPTEWEILYENTETVETETVELVKVPEESDFYSISLKNVPSFNSDRREPFMPPDRYVKQRIIIRKKSRQPASLEDNLAISAGRFTAWKKMIKQNLVKVSEIKQTAKNLTRDVTKDEEKVRLIYEFCQKEIRNLEVYYPVMTEKEKKEIKFNQSVKETLKNKVGNTGEIRNLFGAMVNTLGLDVSLAVGYDRKEFVDFAYKNVIADLMIIGVGVKINNEWICLNPSNPFLPFKKQIWEVEGQNQMMVNDSEIEFVSAPQLVDKSLIKRFGDFTLSENGDLEGEVKIEWIGYKSFEQKTLEVLNTKEELEQSILNEVKERIRDAEISGVRLENYGVYTQPYKYSYHIRIPKYGQRSGKRLFWQPSYFEYKTAPLFYSSTRIYPIYFPHPWSESDEINFRLPKDYKLEVNPNINGVADPDRLSLLTMDIKNDDSQNSLKFKRNFYFGKTEGSLFINSYQAVKQLFDSISKADSRVLVSVKN